MALEPDSFINDFIDEFDGAELIRFICPRDTFAMIGKQSPAVVDNAATAFLIAPDTESPIEVILGAAAHKFFRMKFEKHPNVKFAYCGQSEEDDFTSDHTLLMPQYKWRNYRIDWVVKVTFLKQPYFFIECDGRDFHSSEKQLLRDQKKNDAARDAGIPIFRFSGSDIDRNPGACVSLIFAEIEAQHRRECDAGLHGTAH